MAKTGKCPRCPYRMRLRKDGTMMNHLLYGAGDDRRWCEGGGLRPVDDRPATPNGEGQGASS